jgi:adenosylcobyric acid synthase
VDQLTELTGRPTYGVVPYEDRLWLDAEDSLSVQPHGVVGRPQPPRGDAWLEVAAIRLPRISNSTDVEALACEPGVLVRWVTDPAELTGADVVVLPGSKSTVADLGWLRERGLADQIVEHAAVGNPVLGVCGGFQMLCREIEDRVESGAGAVAGLGLLDADIVFDADKTLRVWRGEGPTPLRGYEIHHGRVVRHDEDDWLGVGIRRGGVFGTHWHGLFDNDDVRRAWLREVAAGRPGFVVADDVEVTRARDDQCDVMADLLAAHLDLDALFALLETGPPARPVLSTRRSTGVPPG